MGNEDELLPPPPKLKVDAHESGGDELLPPPPRLQKKNSTSDSPLPAKQLSSPFDLLGGNQNTADNSPLQNVVDAFTGKKPIPATESKPLTQAEIDKVKQTVQNQNTPVTKAEEQNPNLVEGINQAKDVVATRQKALDEYNKVQSNPKAIELQKTLAEKGKKLDELNNSTQVKAIADLYKQLNSAVENKDEEATKAIKAQIDHLESQPIDYLPHSETGVFANNPDEPANPQIQKLKADLPNMPKTYGELMKKYHDESKAYNEAHQEYNQIVAPALAAKKEAQVAAQFTPNENGVKEKTGFVEGFGTGLKNTIGNIASGLLRATGNDDKADALREHKRMNDEIYPEELKGISANTGELLGGVTPYVAGSLIAPQAVLAQAAAGGTLMGLAAKGETYDNSYNEALASGLSIPEAQAKATHDSNVSALAQGSVGAIMPFNDAIAPIFKAGEMKIVEKALTDAGLNLSEFGLSGAAEDYLNGKDVGQGAAERLKQGAALMALMHLAHLPAAAKEIVDNSIARRLPDVEAQVNSMIANGQMTPEQGETFLKPYRERAEVMATMPPDLSSSKEQKIYPLMQEKLGLVEKKSTLDKVFHEGIDKKIESIDGEIKDIMAGRGNDETIADRNARIANDLKNDNIKQSDLLHYGENQQAIDNILKQTQDEVKKPVTAETVQVPATETQPTDQAAPQQQEPVNTGEQVNPQDGIVNNQNPNQDAIQEPSTTSVPVQSEATNSEGISGGNAEGGETTQEGQPQAEPSVKENEITQNEPTNTSEPQTTDGESPNAEIPNQEELKTGDQSGTGGEQNQPNIAETPQAEDVGRVTGSKNEITDKELSELGLDPIEKVDVLKNKDAFESAKKKVDSGEIDPIKLAKEKNAEKNPFLTAEETFAMMYKRGQILKDYDTDTAELKKEADSEDKLRSTELAQKIAKHESDYNEIAKALKSAGTEAGRSLQARTREMGNTDYSLLAVKQRLKEANADKPIPKEVETKIEGLVSDLGKANAKIAEHEARIKLLEKSKTKPEVFKSRLKGKDLIAEGLHDIGSILGAVKNFDAPENRATLTAALSKIGQGLIDEGLATVDNVWAKVKEHIKENLGRDIPEDYRAEVESGVEDSAKLRGYKNRTRKVIEKRQAKLDSGDFSKEVKNKIPLDREALRLKGEAEKIKHKIDLEQAKIEEANLPKLDKVLDWAARWKRFAVLTYTSTIGKLVSAGVEQALIFTPARKIAQTGLSKLPYISRIAEKAPTEGHYSVKALAANYAEWFRKEAYKDAFDKIKGGKDSIEAMHGKERVDARHFTDFASDVHGAIKVLPKRAEYFSSLQSAAEWAIENDMDLTDPETQEFIHNIAYDNAVRNIFMNKNQATDFYRTILHRLEDSGAGGKILAAAIKVDLPVVSVPTNIVNDVASYTAGAAKAAWTIYKHAEGDIDKLTPKQADHVMRSLGKQTIGLLAMGAATAIYRNIGGFYHKGQKDNSGIKEGTIKAGDANIPSMFLHHPALIALQAAADMQKQVEKYKAKGDEHPNANAALKTTLAVASTIPFLEAMSGVSDLKDSKNPVQLIEKMAASQARGFIPGAVQEAAKAIDTDANGNKIDRNEKNPIDKIKAGIPFLRETIPSKNTNHTGMKSNVIKKSRPIKIPK